MRRAGVGVVAALVHLSIYGEDKALRGVEKGVMGARIEVFVLELGRLVGVVECAGDERCY